jgi:hypothetical protein
MMENLEQFILGESNQIIEFDSREDNRELANAMASQARHSIKILTPDLENSLYDSETFIHALTSLSTQSRFSEIRILLKDSMRPVKSGHRLIELARRFPTCIQIHKPDQESKLHTGSFLIADTRGYIDKKNAERYEGTANFNDPLKTRELNNHFDAAWERSVSDSDLRRLYI